MSKPVLGEARQQSLKMLYNTDSWNNWPVLPVKRRQEGKMPECGTVLDSVPNEVYRNSVFLVTMFEQITGETPRMDYLNFEEMLDDGWEVD